MTFQIKSPLGARPTVRFRCAACNRRLTAPLIDAGKQDRCPFCQTPVRVPGEEGLALWQRHQAAKVARKQPSDPRPVTPAKWRWKTVVVGCLLVGALLIGGFVYSRGWAGNNEVASIPEKQPLPTTQPVAKIASTQPDPGVIVEVTGDVPTATVTFGTNPKPVVESSFGHFARVGDLDVFVSLVEVRPAQTGTSAQELEEIFSGRFVPKKPLPWITVVNVTVWNKSSTKKLDFMTWRGIGRSSFHATIEDNFGNKYKTLDELTFPASLNGEVAIYPKEIAADQLIFERLVPDVESIILHLPCKNLGADGVIQVHVKKSEIKWFGQNEGAKSP